MERILQTDYLIIFNGIANGIICLSMAIFMVFIFGRNSFLYKRPFFEALSVKMGLALVSCASLYNSIKLPVPSVMEVVMHIGLAVVFLWAVAFHWHYFIRKR